MRSNSDLVFTGDWHLHHRPPESRAENVKEWYDFQKQTLEALEKASRIWRGKWIVGGDLIHRPEPNYFTYKLLKEFCPQISCVGNHDCYGNNTSHLSEMHVDLMNDLEIQYMKGHGYTMFQDDLAISFYGDGEEETEQFLKGEIKCNTKIAVVHATVGYGESPYWIDVKSLPDVGCEYVFLADVHKPFEYTNQYGTKFINTGSVIQRNKSETHNPSYWRYNTKTGEHSIETIDGPKPRWKELGEEYKEEMIDVDEINRLLKEYKTASRTAEEVITLVAEQLQLSERDKAEALAYVNN